MEQLRAQRVRIQVWMWTRMLTVVVCLSTASTAAQPTPVTGADLPWASDDDPIGVHREDADLDRGPTPPRAPDAQAFGPKPPALSARSGDVIVAPALVRETQHKVHLAWQAGLTLVTTELHFTTTGSVAAEVKYRLPLPADATLSTLEVCAPTGCRDGLVEPSGALWSAYDDAVQSRGREGALPVGHVHVIGDERGSALSLRAAPVRAHQELIVRVAFLVPTPVRGGVVRLTLAARGMDERAVAAEVTVSAPELGSVSLADAPLTSAPALLEPWRPITLVGRWSSTTPFQARVLDYPCGDGMCGRAWIAARAAAASPVDVALVIDASPSMRGPARGRIAATLAALLALLPPERPLSVATFAADARLVHDSIAAGELPLLPLIDASQAEDLGSGTRFTAAWEALRSWTERPATARARKLLVVIGDGSVGKHQEAAFAQARHRGIAVSWINLADRATDPRLKALIEPTGGITVDAAKESALATGGGDPGALEEALQELLAPVAEANVTLRAGRATGRIKLGPLRAGTELTWQGPLSRGQSVTIGGRRVALTRPGSRPVRGQPLANGPELSDLFVQAVASAWTTTSALAAVDPKDFERLSQDRPRPAPQCDPRGPARRESGVSTDVDPVSLAEARPCRPAQAELAPRRPQVAGGAQSSAAPELTAGVGMPASPLLTMLRQRILPVARACFRRDRAGRAEYELRATFDLELSNQEVTDASVTGDVPEALRACLIEAAERLEVPLFSGTVRARYPLRTQSEPLPDEIELTPGVAADLDRLLDADRGALHTPPAF